MLFCHMLKKKIKCKRTHMPNRCDRLPICEPSLEPTTLCKKNDRIYFAHTDVYMNMHELEERPSSHKGACSTRVSSDSKLVIALGDTKDVGQYSCPPSESNKKCHIDTSSFDGVQLHNLPTTNKQIVNLLSEMKSDMLAKSQTPSSLDLPCINIGGTIKSICVDNLDKMDPSEFFCKHVAAKVIKNNHMLGFPEHVRCSTVLSEGTLKWHVSSACQAQKESKHAMCGESLNKIGQICKKDKRLPQCTSTSPTEPCIRLKQATCYDHNLYFDFLQNSAGDAPYIKISELYHDDKTVAVFNTPTRVNAASVEYGKITKVAADKLQPLDICNKYIKPQFDEILPHRKHECKLSCKNPKRQSECELFLTSGAVNAGQRGL